MVKNDRQLTTRTASKVLLIGVVLQCALGLHLTSHLDEVVYDPWAEEAELESINNEYQ